MISNRSIIRVPPLVKRAYNLAEQMNTEVSCSPESGRLLQLLTSQLQSGVVGEISTGCGVAAAWIVSALSSGTSFFTVDQGPVAAAAVRALLGSSLNVRVVQGDWREFLRTWRFGLLYAGPKSAREVEPELLLQSLRVGGMIVLDGLIPRDRKPLDALGAPDPIRDFWLSDSRLLATEILISPQEAVILATLAG
jgi:predicted O-methyltransferase YrrM